MAPRRLNLRHIEAFRSVLATGSMTEAARQIHTSQPQVSRLIGQLEAIAGFPLFHRNGSRLTPTSDAVLFSDEVEKTFAGLAALELAAARIRSFGSSQLSVAAMPRLASGILAKAVARFKQEYPDVIVSIHSGDANAVQAWVSSGVCDIGLAMVYGDVTEGIAENIMSLDCVAILPKGDPLTASKRLRAHDFDGKSFVSFSRESKLRARIEQAFWRAKVEPHVVAEANLGASICSLVAAGVGSSIINPLAASEERLSGQIEIRPFLPKITFNVVLLYPQPGVRTRLVSTFSKSAVDVIREELRGISI
ncbi:LysR substrate-binding domain-containing protein [Brucella intermedia]|uniref:LysR substrate-binding domain-containing protein n=1 Tax=Brucella intermedia TaxID=94625 RepID=UPI00224ABD83|nr:LysR substrate-binding domain-containing protein [Brucella intermedia]